MTGYVLYYLQCHEYSPLLRNINHQRFRDEEFISIPRSPEYDKHLAAMDSIRFIHRIRLMLPALLNEN
jgi:hypothetical protein